MKSDCLRPSFPGVNAAPQYSLNLTAAPRSVKRTKKSESRGLRFQTAGGLPTELQIVALLNLYGRARVRKFLPDGLGFFFGTPFFYRFGGRLDEILRFLQTQRRYFADDLDDVDLLAASGLQNPVKLGFLSRRRCSATAGSSTSRSRSYGRCRRNPEGLFHKLHQL